MSERKLPYMPYYVAHWAHEAAEFTLAERGALIALVERYWTAGSLPTDDAVLARIARATQEEWLAVKKNVLSLFDVEGDRLENTHLDKQRAYSHEAGAKAASSGSEGGRSTARRWKYPTANGKGKTEGNAL
jgi:uncharacterized protein YdaU (DUF1376 family)